MPGPLDRKSRDRARTETSILAAAREVLAASGFQGLGINAVARRAGCDKQLIYRYFGGLDGLVDAIGLGLADWLEDRLGDTGEPLPTTYAELTERMVLGFLDALIADRLVQRIAAWEIADASPLVTRLTAARSAALIRWVARERGNLNPPPGRDAAAINAVLIGAVQQLALSGAVAGEFSGLALRTEADWVRVRAALITIVRAVYVVA